MKSNTYILLPTAYSFEFNNRITVANVSLTTLELIRSDSLGWPHDISEHQQQKQGYLM